MLEIETKEEDEPLSTLLSTQETESVIFLADEIRKFSQLHACPKKKTKKRELIIFELKRRLSWTKKKR